MQKCNMFIYKNLANHLAYKRIRRKFSISLTTNLVEIQNLIHNTDRGPPLGRLCDDLEAPSVHWLQ